MTYDKKNQIRAHEAYAFRMYESFLKPNINSRKNIFYENSIHFLILFDNVRRLFSNIFDDLPQIR